MIQEDNYTRGLLDLVDEELKKHRLRGPAAFKARQAIKGHIESTLVELEDLRRQLR